LNRDEWVFGVGPDQFLGDLGGTPNAGTHGIADFNFGAIRYAAMVGYRHRIGRRWAFKPVLTAGMVYGNDELSSNFFRHNRNLNFRSPVIELSGQFEYMFYQYDHAGHRYNIRHAHGFRRLALDAYLFGGLGGFYFNPQGNWNGIWYDLRPLSTEGEGLPGGPGEYSQFAISIPLGIGVKYLINQQWSVGMELSDRIWTSTDYLDDTHGNYFSNEEILKYKGPIAAHFADPSLGQDSFQDETGAERGDPKHNDTYFFMFFNVNYRPSPYHRGGHHRRKLKF
jgi:hypothetical protein